MQSGRTTSVYRNCYYYNAINHYMLRSAVASCSIDCAAVYKSEVLRFRYSRHAMTARTQHLTVKAWV
jgi:hypothetical protein